MKNFGIKFIIWYYRMIGVSFGGISLDEKGIIVKSKFWNYFGYFGCLFHFVIVFSLIQMLFLSAIKPLMDSKLVIIKLFLFIWQFLRSFLIISISIINQKYGFKIMNIFSKYSFNNFNKVKLIKMIYIIYILGCLVLFIVNFIEKPTIENFAFCYFQYKIIIGLYYSLSFMSWIIIINFHEILKVIRTRIKNNGNDYRLSDNRFITSKFLIEANKLITFQLRKIHQIDNYMMIGTTLITIGIIFSSLQFVYASVVLNKHYHRFYQDLPYCILFFSQLILNCFINGMLIEEIRNLKCDLDNININVNDHQLYKSLIAFKMSIRNIKSGFTIGGFAPFNKLTLLQVNFKS